MRTAIEDSRSLEYITRAHGQPIPWIATMKGPSSLPLRSRSKSPSPTKKPSQVRKVERQIASGKGPDTIAGSNTYKALCAVCKKWGLPTGTIAQKADMATALIVEQWKKMTSAA